MPRPQTNGDTLGLLCKTILARLENQEAIVYPAQKRSQLQAEMTSKITPFVYTEEDLRNKTLTRIGGRADVLEEADLAESDQFRSAKAVVKKEFGDDELNGFFFQKPLKLIARDLVKYFMSSPLVEDVFGSDEELEQKIVEIVLGFKAQEKH